MKKIGLLTIPILVMVVAQVLSVILTVFTGVPIPMLGVLPCVLISLFVVYVPFWEHMTIALANRRAVSFVVVLSGVLVSANVVAGTFALVSCLIIHYMVNSYVVLILTWLIKAVSLVLIFPLILYIFRSKYMPEWAVTIQSNLGVEENTESRKDKRTISKKVLVVITLFVVVLVAMLLYLRNKDKSGDVLADDSSKYMCQPYGNCENNHETKYRYADDSESVSSFPSIGDWSLSAYIIYGRYYDMSTFSFTESIIMNNEKKTME